MPNKKIKFDEHPRKIEFPRADPDLLKLFDPSTKRCYMNCGQHIDDVRSFDELKFLCNDCEVIDVCD